MRNGTCIDPASPRSRTYRRSASTVDAVVDVLNRSFRVALGAISIACATSIAAKTGPEANDARADGRWGGELGAGYSLPILPGPRVTPAAGVLLYAEDDCRHHFDDDGGNEARRDGTNGRYADRDLRNHTKVRAYGRVEATYSVPLVATFGVGARISDDIVPYGTVAFPIAPKLQLKGNVGDGYYAAGLRLGF